MKDIELETKRKERESNKNADIIVLKAKLEKLELRKTVKEILESVNVQEIDNMEDMKSITRVLKDKRKEAKKRKEKLSEAHIRQYHLLPYLIFSLSLLPYSFYLPSL